MLWLMLGNWQLFQFKWDFFRHLTWVRDETFLIIFCLIVWHLKGNYFPSKSISRSLYFLSNSSTHSEILQFSNSIIFTFGNLTFSRKILPSPPKTCLDTLPYDIDSRQRLWFQDPTCSKHYTYLLGSFSRAFRPINFALATGFRRLLIFFLCLD